MADEGATPDVMERIRLVWEAASRGEFDPMRTADYYSPDAVFEPSCV